MRDDETRPISHRLSEEEAAREAELAIANAKNTGTFNVALPADDHVGQAALLDVLSSELAHAIGVEKEEGKKPLSEEDKQLLREAEDFFSPRAKFLWKSKDGVAFFVEETKETKFWSFTTGRWSIISS